VGAALAADKKSTSEGIHFVLTPGISDVTVKKLTGSQILGAYGRFVRERQKAFDEGRFLMCSGGQVAEEPEDKLLAGMSSSGSAGTEALELLDKVARQARA
jgi:hypothetical protein